MKRRVEIIVALCLFLLPGAAAADFLIILKNGSEFTTPEYWHTYEELRFYYLGGTVGLNRSTIKKIFSLQPPSGKKHCPLMNLRPLYRWEAPPRHPAAPPESQSLPPRKRRGKRRLTFRLTSARKIK